jgi:hypothetical protein
LGRFFVQVNRRFRKFAQLIMPPIEYDEFGFILEGSYEEEATTAPEPEVVEPIVPIREQFPLEGTEYLGGKSDGWEYRTIFAGGRLAVSYQMVLTFLEEHGYSDVPVPANAEELQLFRRQRTPQLQLFPERGYVHNPIKILFHTDPKMRNALVLCIYNEQVPNHLLKFHGVLRPQKKEPQS